MGESFACIDAMLDRVRTVLTTVAASPGLKSKELIDRVVKVAVTTSKDPRRAVSYTAGDLVDRDRLIKRNGRFYPLPKAEPVRG